MTRQTKVLPHGDKRRMSDGRNAWRKMTPEQRRDFLQWIHEEGLPVEQNGDTSWGVGWWIPEQSPAMYRGPLR